MARRGENIRKRKDGRWEGRYIRQRDADGKAKYASVYAYTYAEVRQKLQECRWLADIDEHIQHGENDDVRFSEVLRDWLQREHKSIKEQTYQRYADLIEKHIVPCLGDFAAKKIDTETVNRFVEEKLAAGRLDGTGGLSAKSVRLLTSIVRAAISDATENNRCEALQGHILMPAIRKRKIEVFTAREQHVLEEYLQREIDAQKLGILLALYTGLRLGELCGLRWQDIDFHAQIITVSRTIQRMKCTDHDARRKTVLVIGSPKTESSRRIIPIPAHLHALLYAQSCHKETEYVVPGKRHPFMDPRTYQNRFHMYLNDCDIAPRNFHVLRHTFATRCVEVGMDVKTLSELLGHANVNTTLNLYVHSSLESKRRQMELLQPVWGQTYPASTENN